MDAVDDAVEEAPVVRDHEQRAVEGGEEALEPLQAVAVEVVGRLVEQQHLRVLEQRRRQQGARLLAAGEPVKRAVAGQVVDREALPDLFGARVGGPRVGRVRALERVGVAVEVEVEARQLRVDAKPGFERAQQGERLAGLAQRVADEGVEGRVAGGRLLREVADACARRDRAAVGVLAPGQQAQQGRLAGAVGAGEPGALAGCEGQREPVEEGRAVIAFRQVECS